MLLTPPHTPKDVGAYPLDGQASSNSLEQPPQRRPTFLPAPPRHHQRLPQPLRICVSKGGQRQDIDLINKLSQIIASPPPPSRPPPPPPAPSPHPSHLRGGLAGGWRGLEFMVRGLWSGVRVVRVSRTPPPPPPAPSPALSHLRWGVRWWLAGGQGGWGLA